MKEKRKKEFELGMGADRNVENTAEIIRDQRRKRRLSSRRTESLLKEAVRVSLRGGGGGGEKNRKYGRSYLVLRCAFGSVGPPEHLNCRTAL